MSIQFGGGDSGGSSAADVAGNFIASASKSDVRIIDPAGRTINPGQVFLSATGWDPITSPIPGNTTPSLYPRVFIGDEYVDVNDTPSKQYIWESEFFVTNSGKSATSATLLAAHGFKPAGLNAVARVSGLNGLGYGGEFEAGAYLSRATVQATNGSAVLTIGPAGTGVTWPGSRFDADATSIVTDSAGGIPANTHIAAVDNAAHPTSITLSAAVSGLSQSPSNVNITVQTQPSNTFGLLVSGSGGNDSGYGGLHGAGNPNGIGIAIQAYANSAFSEGIHFSGSGLQSEDGTASDGFQTGAFVMYMSTVNTGNKAALTANANSGQAVFTISSTGALPTNGTNVRLTDSNGTEIVTVSSVTGGAVTCTGNLTNSYTTANKATATWVPAGAGIGYYHPSCTMGDGMRWSGGTYNHVFAIQSGTFCNAEALLLDAVTTTNETILVNNCKGTYGIRFASNNTYTAGTAIRLEGMNIDSDTTTGMKISTAASHKVGFFGATPIVQPSGTPAAATDLATVLTLANALRTGLLNLGIVA